MTPVVTGEDGDGGQGPIDRRRHVAEYFRLQRWEIPPPAGAEGFSEIGGRAPIDDHLRNAAGGLRTGALLTSLDSLGGLLSGLSVHPRWIVTTSMSTTVTTVIHAGPLRMHGRVLRRGRNTVVTGLDVVDEGSDDRVVAAATMSCAVLDPGDRDLHFERPYSTPMPPPRPDAPRPGGVLLHRARWWSGHHPSAGRPSAQPVGDPPRGGGGHAGGSGRLPRRRGPGHARARWPPRTR